MEDFDKWLETVSKLVEEKLGVGLDDLPDMDFWAYYMSTESPQHAALVIAAIALNGEL